MRFQIRIFRKCFGYNKILEMTPKHSYHATDAWLLASLLGSSKDKLCSLDEIFEQYDGIRKLGLGNIELKVGLYKLKDDGFIIESEQEKFSFYINPSILATMPKGKYILDNVDFFKAFLSSGHEDDIKYTADELKLCDPALTDDILNKARKKYSKRIYEVIRNLSKS